MREATFLQAAHSADAIQRAAYRFSDRLTLDLDVENGNYRCFLYPRNSEIELDDSVVNDFRLEVLDQTLRERIRAETADIRNAILALAFSQTGLTDSEPDGS